MKGHLVHLVRPGGEPRSQGAIRPGDKVIHLRGEPDSFSSDGHRLDSAEVVALLFKADAAVVW